VDISNDLAKGGGDKFVRQIDWLCKLCIPRHHVLPLRKPHAQSC
jgi:hypothetical protein